MSHATVTAAKSTAVAAKSPRRQPVKQPVQPVTTTVVTQAKATTTKVQDPKALKARLENVVTKKVPNDLHKQYCAWIKAQTGFVADPKTVQVLLASYHDFQASPEKQKAQQASKTDALKAQQAKLDAAKAKVLADAKRLGLTL